MADKKSSIGSLAKQIDTAKKNIESWPSWLRESARFEGKNHPFDEQTNGDKQTSAPNNEARARSGSGR